MRKAAGWACTIVVLMVMATVHRVVAQDQEVAYTANVHVGDCEGDLGEVLVPLTDPTPATGPSVGQATAAVTTTSFTTVPVALDQLLAVDHTIGIQRDGDEASLACGELGGNLSEQGALVIGLRGQADSGVTGVVYLAPSIGGPSQTDISVLLVTADTAPEERETPAPDERAAETESLETEGVDAVATPGGDTADAPFSDDERQYATTLARQSTLLIASLRRVDSLFENPRTGDEGWTNQLAAELTLWQILNDEAQEIEPPAAFTEVHATYLDALGLLDNAASDIFSGLAGGDQERITQGTERIEEAVGRLDEASRLVDELAAEQEA